ncbi:MAG: rhomboid family intramembrane serine protease [Thermodesulfobacteriota bacterium]
MRPAPGGGGIDRCLSCGAAWFDPGEIRELTEGRFPGEESPGAAEDALPHGSDPVSGRMARAWKEAGALSCPRCSRRLSPIDFQNTGIPVFRCRECGGLLVSRAAVGELARRFGFHRRNAALYNAMGETLAMATRHRFERQYGPDTERALRDARPPGLPVVVPLADAADSPASPPVVTWGLLGLMAALHIFGTIGVGGMAGLPDRLGLAPGTGFGNVPPFALWLAPLFHGGIVPLVVGSLFLFVLGDNVEERVGRLPFLASYLACGAIAGTAHVLWGKVGAPPALGSAGAVAGVLGAYLVFFPEVPISMYGAGKVVSVPAYIFACAWAVALFLWGWGSGPLAAFLDPAPYSLAGSLAGFAAGAAGAAAWRSMEDRSSLM